MRTIGESELVPDAVKEQLQGVLDSSDAYFEWLANVRQSPHDEDRERSIAKAIEAVRDHVLQGEIALNAVESIFAGTAEATADALPILAELADRCWAEVEDYFLSQAEYDDEGDTVPLSEVKANLGL